MKKIFIFLVLILLLVEITSSAEKVQKGYVTNLSGEVSLQKKETSVWVKPKLYSTIHSEDKIKTGRQSRAELTFDEGTVIRIEENTLLVVSTSDPKVINLDLPEGKILTSTIRGGKNRTKLRIATPSAVLAVRGTDFLAEVDKNQTTKLAVFKGTVFVQSETKKLTAVTVEEGQETLVHLGEIPLRPFALTEAMLKYREKEYKEFEKQVHETRQMLEKLQKQREKEIVDFEKQREKEIEKYYQQLEKQFKE